MVFLYVFFNLILSLSYINTQDITENELLVLNGSYQTGEYYFGYGSVYYDNGNINGILLIKNSSDFSLIKKIEYEDSNLEMFHYLAEVDNNTIMIVCEQFNQTIGYEAPYFKQTIIIEYDFSGNLLNQFILHDKYVEYHNHNHYLVMTDSLGKMIYLNSVGKPLNTPLLKVEYYDFYMDQFQGEAFINGSKVDNINIDYPGIYSIDIIDGDYCFSYAVTVIPIVSISGEQYQDFYVGDVVIFSKGIIFINQEEYENNTVINTPGNYNIVIYGGNGYEYSTRFTILPNISYFDGINNYDFKEGLEINKPIKIYTNGIANMVDGEPYQSNYIDKIGHHVLTVYGAYGYSISLEFSILPSVTGLEDNQIYESLHIHIFGNAYLNNKLVTGDIFITDPGEYQLQLLFEENVYRSYFFTIKPLKSNHEETQSKLIYFDILFLLIISVGGFYILRKK